MWVVREELEVSEWGWGLQICKFAVPNRFLPAQKRHTSSQLRRPECNRRGPPPPKLVLLHQSTYIEWRIYLTAAAIDERFSKCARSILSDISGFPPYLFSVKTTSLQAGCSGAWVQKSRWHTRKGQEFTQTIARGTKPIVRRQSGKHPYTLVLLCADIVSWCQSCVRGTCFGDDGDLWEMGDYDFIAVKKTRKGESEHKTASKKKKVVHTNKRRKHGTTAVV